MLQQLGQLACHCVGRTTGGVGGKDGRGGGRGELSWCLWGGSNISVMMIRQGLERGLWEVPGHLLENSAEEWPRTRL